MEKNLADALADIALAKKTGVLSVSVRNDNNQLKFFFRDGGIYHVTYSGCRNLECLIRLGALDMERGFFIPGVKMDGPHGITLGTGDIIEQTRKLGKVIQWTPEGTAGGRPASSAPGGEQTVNGSAFQRLEEELLSLVGPAGAIVYDHACSACGVTPGTVVPRKTFQLLVQTIAKQIPEDRQKLFLAKFAF